MRDLHLKELSMILTTSFYNMNQKILTKKVYFQIFSWFQFYIYKLCMIMCIVIAPQTTVVNWFASTKIYVKIALILHWNDFCLGEMCFMEETYK